MSGDPLSFGSDAGLPSESDWMALVEKTLKGKPVDKALTRVTVDGISVKALATKDNSTVQAQPAGRKGPWTMMSPHWGRDAKQVNTALLDDLLKGASGFALAVGHSGIAAEGLSVALDGVYLDMVPFALLPGEEFAASSSRFADVVQERAYKSNELKGTLGADPIGTLARTGRLLTPADEAIEEAAQIAREWAGRYPGVATFVADGTPYHDAGASDVQELAAVLSTAVRYLRALETAGLSLEQAASQIQFTLAADAGLWTTIAKFRAFRRAWQQVLGACGVKGCTPRVAAVSAMRMFTFRDPWVNILRGTASCFAAAAGGADSVTVLPHDLYAGQSSAFARRVARNIQVILQEESNLARVTDPAAGSYSIETITADLCGKALKAFQSMESEGGVLDLLKAGRLQADIADIARVREKAVRTRKMPITGVSEFPNIHEEPLDLHAVVAAPEDTRPEAGDTVEPLSLNPLAAPFELLRARPALMEEAPTVHVVNLGTPADFTARATFAKNFFEAGGVEALTGAGTENADGAVDEFKASGARIAVICATDSQYEEMGDDIARAIKDAGCSRLYLAGRPANDDALIGAGVDEFIFMGCDVVAALEGAYEALGFKNAGEMS